MFMAESPKKRASARLMRILCSNLTLIGIPCLYKFLYRFLAITYADF